MAITEVSYIFINFDISKLITIIQLPLILSLERNERERNKTDAIVRLANLLIDKIC